MRSEKVPSTDLTTPKFDFRSSPESRLKSDLVGGPRVADPSKLAQIAYAACCLATSSSRWSSGRRVTWIPMSEPSCVG
jgi:hypothetical protein